jgi:hypothetical protein
MNKDTAAMIGLLLGAGARFGRTHQPMSSEVHLINILYPDRAAILIEEALEESHQTRRKFDTCLREIRQREQAKG